MAGISKVGPAAVSGAAARVVGDILYEVRRGVPVFFSPPNQRYSLPFSNPHDKTTLEFVDARLMATMSAHFRNRAKERANGE